MQSNNVEGDVSFYKIVQILNKIFSKCLKFMLSCARVTTDKHIVPFPAGYVRVEPACFGRGETEVGFMMQGFPRQKEVRNRHR